MGTDSNDLALDGYVVRPLEPGDARAAWEVYAANEEQAIGTVEIEEADIVADWQRPSFDLATQSIGVFEPTDDGERLVGAAEVYLGRRADAAVHPEFQGRGIGTALALWTQGVSRRDGAGLVGMPVPEGSRGEALLRDLGYEALWTSWVLALPEGKAISPQPLPDGYTVREARPDEYRAAHAVVDAAFLEWSERDPEDYADFEAGSVKRPGFEPWNFRVATDPAGEIVGVSIVLRAESYAYVSRLAVRRDQRGLGLARALLVDSFEVARQHGAERSELSTDSRTGALGLYERVGMEVTNVWRHWAKQT